MLNEDQDTSPNTIAEWVITLFDELQDQQALEVVLIQSVRAATVECRGAKGRVRRRRLPSRFVAGVFAKMKRLAGLDVAKRRHMQCGRVRLLNFHGRPAEFEVTTGCVGISETLSLRRL